MYGGEAHTIAEVCEDDPAAGRIGPLDADQFTHQKLIGKPMKPIAANAFGLVSARDRQQLSHARHIVVKRGVEAGDLRDIREAAMERFCQ